jgi:hypothetical protein
MIRALVQSESPAFNFSGLKSANFAQSVDGSMTVTHVF